MREIKCHLNRSSPIIKVEKHKAHIRKWKCLTFTKKYLLVKFRHNFY